MAETLGLRALQVDGLSTLGVVRIQQGDPGGLADLEAGLALGEEISSPQSIRAHINLASILMDIGELRQSAGLHAEGIRVAERFGANYGLRHLKGEQGWDFWWAGRWDEALSRADEMIAAVEGGSSHQMASACYLLRGLIRLARSDPAGADADSARALELGRAGKDPQNLYPILGSRARVLIELGRRDEGERLVDELLSLWVAKPYVPNSVVVDLAACLFELGRSSPVLPTAPTLASPWLEAANHVLAGELRRAADILAETEALPLEASIRLRAAEAFLEEGRRAEADPELRRALDFYRNVGATAYLARAEKLLAASA